MSIGHLDWNTLLAHARDLSRCGGREVPESAAELADLPVSGPREILRVSRSAARRDGALLMSSGGTTGKPKLTYVPHHQALDRLRREWRPLRPDSVLLNLFNPGRLWGSHYYMQALAEHSECTAVPSGPYAPEEVGNWLEMFRDIGLNALAGTPTGVADFAQGVLDAGGELDIDTIIWMAEPWTDAKFETVTRAFPNAGFWANYGSVETYVIATNTPDCERDVLHLMADQVLEPDDGGALLTRTGDGWTVPVVRYRLGDRVEAASCRCGRPRALRVVGRADDSVSLRSALFSVGQVLKLAGENEGVEEAQLVLTRSEDSPKAASSLTLEFTGSADPERVRGHLLEELYHLAAVAQRYPGSVITRRVERLTRVERTNKVPAVVWADNQNTKQGDQ